MSLRNELIVSGPTYRSQGDEKAFFTWLGSIACVDEVVGVGQNLIVRLKRKPSSTDLREFLGIFYRYRINMKPLAIFMTPRNQAWFCDPNMYWYKNVFG